MALGGTLCPRSREDDYRMAWAYFEEQNVVQTTSNNSTQG